MTTLHTLARDLGITGHSVYVLAGHLVTEPSDRPGGGKVAREKT